MGRFGEILFLSNFSSYYFKRFLLEVSLRLKASGRLPEGVTFGGLQKNPGW